MSERDKRTSTKLVEGGRRKEWRGRLVNPPVERASTILFDSIAELDSMAVVTILTTLEERFGIVVNDDEVDSGTFASVGSLMRFVETKLAR